MKLTEQELIDKLQNAVARYNSLTPEQKEQHDKAQRASFMKGMEPCIHGDRDWETCSHCRAALQEVQE